MDTRLLALLTFLLVITSSASNAWAKPLQIIHTNDLHSHFEGSDIPGRGGYAAVKAKIDELKNQARDAGIETLIVDAGDFSEGTMFYLSDNGEQSWKLMEAMGYDAVTIGNHDWLVGTGQMDRILGGAAPRVPFLSANLKFGDEHANLAKHVSPSLELTRAGARIALLGLSTDDIFYNWRAKPGFIGPPILTARKHLKELRKRNDYVIALTHLGINKDQALVQHTSGIDLVIGGHSHTYIYEPFFQKNQKRKPVPIVQAGKHGEYVGDLLVDLEPGLPLKILRYQLVPVDSNGSKDAQMEDLIRGARKRLEDAVGTQWLYETLTYTDIPMEVPEEHATHWGTQFAEALKETASADVALDVSAFYGSSQSAGPITREKLIQFYPRVFDLTKPTGWTIWSIQAPGWLIQMVFELGHDLGHYLNSAGITYTVKENSPNGKLGDFRINGKRLNPLKNYRVAVTEGIGRGTSEISLLLKAIFAPRDTGVPVWAAFEQKIRSQPSLY